MNPYPLVSLNHFTVPSITTTSAWSDRVGPQPKQTLPRLNQAPVPTMLSRFQYEQSSHSGQGGNSRSREGREVAFEPPLPDLCEQVSMFSSSPNRVSFIQHAAFG